MKEEMDKILLGQQKSFLIRSGSDESQASCGNFCSLVRRVDAAQQKGERFTKSVSTFLWLTKLVYSTSIALPYFDSLCV